MQEQGRNIMSQTIPSVSFNCFCVPKYLVIELESAGLKEKFHDISDPQVVNGNNIKAVIC